MRKMKQSNYSKLLNRVIMTNKFDLPCLILWISQITSFGSGSQDFLDCVIQIREKRQKARCVWNCQVSNPAESLLHSRKSRCRVPT